MKKTVLKEYAKLIVRTGANVQKGQGVLIRAELDQPEFVQMVVEEAYKAKYSDIKNQNTKYFIECEYKKERKDGGYSYNYRQVPVFESFEKTNEVLDMFYNEHFEEINK